MYDTGDTRNFNVEYDDGHIHDMVALGHQNFSVTAASTHTSSIRRAGNSSVSSKLADQIRRWEFTDMADLLLEVRLSNREGELEKLLQNRPRCVTDIWSWLNYFGMYVSVLGPFYP